MSTCNEMGKPQKKSLAAALQSESTRLPRSTSPQSASENKVEQPQKESSYIAPSRRGKKVISGHFDKEVLKQLKLLCVETDSSVQGLLAEALNDLFTKHGKSPIA
ncbi:MAG: ribbon-helix-helix domain-containing protein [Cyanobacteria bacterium P01_A01_bin.17]